MQGSEIINSPKLQFKELPAFAEYILKDKIRDFTKKSLEISFEVDFPILKYFDLSKYTEEELIALSTPSYSQFLKAAAQNKLIEFIDETVNKWETNQLPSISNDQLVVEDITLSTYIRKKGLLNFIPNYTNDPIKIIGLVNEIDEYILLANQCAFKAYIRIHEKRMNTVTESLYKHEAELLEAQEIAGFGSFDWDLKGDGSKFTPKVLDIFEMEATSNLSDFLEFVHPGDREKLKEAISKALTGDGDYECEYRYRKNGKEKILWSKGLVNFKDGKPHVMKGTVMDITDRHYMLQTLKRNEELYKQAQKITHIGNWTWELETGNLKFSDETYRIYGLNIGEEMTYEKFISFIHPDDKEKVTELLKYSQKTLQAHTVDFRIIRKDGEMRIIRRNAEVLVDEKGIPYKIAGTGQDITKEVALNREILEREEKLEQKKNELAELNLSLEQKNLALERSNKELTSFSYVASHDLQEPIRKIKTFSNLILEKENELSDEGRQCFERIIISAGRMQKLIEDLLSFSRTQSYENTVLPVDLNSVLNEVRSIYADAINDKRLFIQSVNLPELHGVQFQLQQLFENIIGNSVKYRKEGQKAELIINCEKIEGKKIPFINTHEVQNFYKISFKDNGIGFDQKYADKIFEIFQRLHGKNEYTGTGIGLSICKRIVENHHGFISAQSKPNEGATFDVYLPTLSVNQ